MKANEAPEKIYLLPRQGGDYAPYWRTDSQDGFGIEYTRTDAFIEKAVDYIAYNMQCTGYTLQTKAEFIRDFKKYMED